MVRDPEEEGIGKAASSLEDDHQEKGSKVSCLADHRAAEISGLVCAVWAGDKDDVNMFVLHPALRDP